MYMYLSKTQHMSWVLFMAACLGSCVLLSFRVGYIHVNKAKQGKVNGSTQGRQLISKSELP